MKRWLVGVLLLVAVAPLAGCVVYAPGPGPVPYAGAYWVRGHYGPNGYWIPGHWA
jgi:hypothetical protein